MMACRVIAVAVVLLVGAGPAAAGAPTDRLRAFFDRVNHVILAPETDGGLEDRLSTVRGLVNELVDFEGAAALALGRHWDSLPPAERAAFTRLYAEIVERAYVSWIAGKARLGEDGVSVRWLQESVDDATATVSSMLLTRTGGEVDIDYRLVRRGADWLVRDVLVDGVSLAANYRVQFERVLQQGSYADLVVRMQEKAGPAARAQGAAVTAAPVPARDAAPPPSAPVVPPPMTAAPPVTPSSRTAASPPVVVAAIRDDPRAVVTDVRPSTLTELAASPPPAGQEPGRTISTLAPPTTTAKAPAAATAAVTTRRVPPPRELWVQVGGLRTVDAAARMMQQLRRYAVTLAIGADRQVPRARVLVGPFTDRSAAVSTVRALHASGLAAFITDTPD
jgi:phospholipid transport system substrate-binding protein